ncbi:hypothetical protein GOP47_0029829 [Adiantum capillus-veneris]|nr:hypothetical protein GOP47_0029829 [Adiantum capillus-veneris]
MAAGVGVLQNWSREAWRDQLLAHTKGSMSACSKPAKIGLIGCTPACYAHPIPAASPNKARAGQSKGIFFLQSRLRRRHGVFLHSLDLVGALN